MLARTMESTIRSAAPGTTVIALNGRLTLGNASQRVEWLIEDQIKQGNTKLILDMAEVSYLDSAGLGILMISSGRAQKAGGALRVARLTDRVREVLRLTHADEVLPVFDTVETAVAAD